MVKKLTSSKWKDPCKDLRSNEELFAESLRGRYDGEKPWQAVSVLRMRGTKEVFDLAKRAFGSREPLVRARALDVLAQIGAAPGRSDAERPYMKRSVPLAVKGMGDRNQMVVYSAAWALAHLRGPRAIRELIKAKRHRDKGVRHAVASGLGGCKTRMAIQTLIELMEDKDKRVRDWATFSISLAAKPVDSPAVRAALRKRLKDRFKDARAEAIWGLAVRKDPEGLKLLLNRLNGKSWTSGDETAVRDLLNHRGNISMERMRTAVRGLIAQNSC